MRAHCPLDLNAAPARCASYSSPPYGALACVLASGSLRRGGVPPGFDCFVCCGDLLASRYALLFFFLVILLLLRKKLVTV